MKIAIVTTLVPFVYGGAEFLAEDLRKQLLLHGYETQIIQFPFSWTPKENIVDAILAARFTRIENTDLVISMKFPAYFITHPNKKMWLIHQFRQAYDLGGTKYDFFTASKSDQDIRQTIIQADNCYLKEFDKGIYTISPIVSERLKQYNNIDSSVLYPPLIDQELYFCDGFDDYIFYPSRVNQSKRQYLAVEAMRYVKSNVKLILAGKGDCKSEEDYIFSVIEKYNLKDKVYYYNEFISQKKKAELYSKCLGCIYIPFEEDYGYVALEAMHSGKPVISCSDSGGTGIFVKNSQTGYITEPTAEALAEVMDRLYNDKHNAKEMGNYGKKYLSEMGINWTNTIRRLVE